MKCRDDEILALRARCEELEKQLQEQADFSGNMLSRAAEQKQRTDKAERERQQEIEDHRATIRGHIETVRGLEDRICKQAELRKDAERERDEARKKLTQLQEWSDAKTVFADDLLSEVRELRAYRDRMEWLHRGNDRDADGYEWGVFRVKWDNNGQPASVLHTLTDLSDLDKAMGASGMPRYYDEITQLRADLAAAREDSARLDWLENNIHALRYGLDCMVCVRGEDGMQFNAETWRAAIDAAKKGSNG